VRAFGHSGHFYESFSGLANQVRRAAGLLEGIIAEPARSAELLEQLAAVDQEASALRVTVIGEIPEVVVTPLPREDVHHVASLLGDTVHVLHGAAQLAVMLHLAHTPPAAAQLAGVLVRAGECIELTVARSRQRDYPTARCEDMERLKDEGSAIWAHAVETLFQGEPDALEVLRWKELYDRLQEALEQCQALDHALDSIILQNRG
jgi:uncharacterized protein Yka (UPF0111/DUF47 family)